MDGYTYLLFSADGDLAGFGAAAEGDSGAPLSSLVGEPAGRVEIWRGDELVAVVGASAPASTLVHDGLF